MSPSTNALGGVAGYIDPYTGGSMVPNYSPPRRDGSSRGSSLATTSPSSTVRAGSTRSPTPCHAVTLRTLRRASPPRALSCASVPGPRLLSLTTSARRL
jgi:hypothetical protein